MDSNPTSKVTEDNKIGEDPQLSCKLSVSSQVQEYYSSIDTRSPSETQNKSLPLGSTSSFPIQEYYSTTDTQIPAALQTKSLPSGSTSSFPIQEYYSSTDTQIPAALQTKPLSLDPTRSLPVQEYYSCTDTQIPTELLTKSLPSSTFNPAINVGRAAYHPSTQAHWNQESHQTELASLYRNERFPARSNKEGGDRVEDGHRPKSLNQIVLESRDISEAVKAALQAGLDTSGPRVPSPASSVASNKRGLEWDSGADVGYHQYEQRDSSHLSIIERLALARGSAAFQLGSSGMETLCTTTLKEKADEESLSKSLASLKIAKSGKTERPRAVDSKQSEPLAQSTPQEVNRRSLILAAAADDDISPLQSHRDIKSVTKFPTMKSLSSTDICMQQQVEEVYSRRKSDTNISQRDLVQQSNLLPIASNVHFSRQLAAKHQTRDQTVQTSDNEPVVEQMSVGIQAGERSDAGNKSRRDTSSGSEKSVSLADAQRFIARIQRNATEHQKVIDKIKRQNLCDAKKPGFRDGSSSSSECNEPASSANATTEPATLGSANSFEYVPGDVYETARSASPAWGAVSRSLARDLDQGVQTFKTLLSSQPQVDAQTKERLIKRLVRKLVETEYQEDEESSSTGASVVYVAHAAADAASVSSRRHRANVRPCSSPGHAPAGDSSQSRGPTSSERSSLAYSASTSTSTTLETADWRRALTQSELRQQHGPDQSQPRRQNAADQSQRRRPPGRRDDELAQISRKIRRLNDLKQLLERPTAQSRDVMTVMAALGVSSGETDQSTATADSTPASSEGTDENWTSHRRLSSRTPTQCPPGCGGGGSSESWDSSRDRRRGRVNVWPRSAERAAAADPPCCCRCERELARLRDACGTPRVKDAATSTSAAGLGSPRWLADRGLHAPAARRDPCLCCGSERQVPSPEGGRRRSKEVQTSESVGKLPMVQARRKDDDCKSCGNENEQPKVLPEPISQDNTEKPTAGVCMVCFVDVRLCRCNGTWDVSAIPGQMIVTQPAPRRAVVDQSGNQWQMVDQYGRGQESSGHNGPGRVCRCEAAGQWEAREEELAGTRSLATETDSPRAVGYVLTFDATSGSDGSLPPPPRPPLAEVRVKQWRPGQPFQPPQPANKRTSMDQPMQTSTPSSSGSLAGAGRREGGGGSASRQPSTRRTTSEGARPTLQDYLRSNRPDYIATAEQRRQCLTELAHLRELRLRSRQKLLALASAPAAAEVLSSLPPPPLAQKRVFSQRSMLQQTRRLTQRTAEVGKKRTEVKRKEDYRTNRLMAEMFARKLQKNVLKGSVNLSNSKSVI